MQAGQMYRKEHIQKFREPEDRRVIEVEKSKLIDLAKLHLVNDEWLSVDALNLNDCHIVAVNAEGIVGVTERQG